MSRELPIFYSCERCPAYCCTYARIEVKKKDIRRLAAHFGVDFETARKRFTKKGEEKGERVLKHQKDQHFGTACRFLDTDARRCSIYEARPAICREFPGTVRCGYYDFLSFERRALEDEDYISTTWNHS